MIFSIGIAQGGGIEELEKDLNLTKNNTQLYEALKVYINTCKSVRSAVENVTSEGDLANLSISNLTILYYDKILYYASFLDENTSQKIEMDCIKAVDEVLNSTKDRLHHYTEKINELKNERANLASRYRSLEEKKRLFENYTALQSEYKELVNKLEAERKNFETITLACLSSSLLVGVIVGRFYHSWIVRKAEIHSLFSRAKLWQNYIVLLVFAVAFALSLVFILLTLHPVQLPSP
jgi:DNA repair exonuclease SbcCD ATPase subunit